MFSSRDKFAGISKRAKAHRTTYSDLVSLWSGANVEQTALALVADDNILQMELGVLSSDNSDFVRAATGFFGNCARWEGSHQRLKEVDLVGKLQPLLERQDGVGFRATRALVLLIGSEEKDNIITPSSGIVDMFIKGLASQLRTGGFFGSSWEASEFLIPIKLLCVSDKNKPGFCESSLFVGLLIYILKNGSEKDTENVDLAVEILLQVSFFYDDALGHGRKGSVLDLCSEDGTNQLKLALENISGPKTEYHQNTKQRAQIVLFALWPELRPKPKIAPQSTSDKHVMLSYSWQTKKPLVELMCRSLKQQDVDVWRDEEGSSILGPMSGSIDDTMAQAVENSSDVVIFLSHAYKASANCQAEARYASRLSKKGRLNLHFVKVDDYDPDGFLGLMLGDRLWETALDQTGAQKAANKLAVTLKASKPLKPKPNHSGAGGHSTGPIQPQQKSAVDFSVEEVGKWLEEEVKLGQYRQAFQKAKMNGASMQMLSTLACSDLNALDKWMERFAIDQIGEFLCIVAMARKTFV